MGLHNVDQSVLASLRAIAPDDRTPHQEHVLQFLEHVADCDECAGSGHPCISGSVLRSIAEDSAPEEDE